MAFIIDSYDQYSKWDRAHSHYVFRVNEQWYAVKEVELEWGLPKLPISIERDSIPQIYHVYANENEAIEFARKLKRLNSI